jgi:hypothetical protein
MGLRLSSVSSNETTSCKSSFKDALMFGSTRSMGRGKRHEAPPRIKNLGNRAGSGRQNSITGLSHALPRQHPDGRRVWVSRQSRRR